MCSSLLHLAPGSHDLTQTQEKSQMLKFVYFEKATNFCEIFTLLLTGTKDWPIKKETKVNPRFLNENK